MLIILPIVPVKCGLTPTRHRERFCEALAAVFEQKNDEQSFADVMKQAYFDAIGLEGWTIGSSKQNDGPRLILDLENMGRLGLLVLARGRWDGRQLVPQSFIEEMERKQTRGMKVNYNGPDDGRVPFSSADFPEAPYGFLTWLNTDQDVYPGADAGWAWDAGAGGSYVLWNHKFGIVFAAAGRTEQGPPPAKEGVPQIIERNLTAAHTKLSSATIHQR